MNSISRVLLILLLVIASIAARAQQRSAPQWDAWQFLQGKWVGEGSSEAGEGSGYFTFEPDLQQKVWVRRNYSEYPATKTRPKYVHEDLMIVYFEEASRQTRAFYCDSEGHIIHYTATFSNDGSTLTFLSDPEEKNPRFRLTYVREGSQRMQLTLEVAQPDKPDEFRKIVEGKVRKLPAS